MNRKKFIESQGATCKNWNWSWSFINNKEKVIIFGAWDIHTEGNKSLIMSEDWEISAKGQKNRGYKQSREHIRLIEEDGYKLKTFPIIYSDDNKDKNGIGPAKIESFIPALTEKSLQRIVNGWYASDGSMSNNLPEEVTSPEKYTEGASITVSINTYERNAKARAKCIEYYGYQCSVCSFDFEKAYGVIGEKYIHVHHIIPLVEIGQEYELDPIKDLIPVCPNCHAMIHRTGPKPLTVEQLKLHLSNLGLQE